MPQRYKILITGSSGMLGVDLWQELSADYELYGLDVLKGQKSFECDITDRHAVAEIVSKV